MEAGTMRILALNWRCPRHPQAGGAEANLFEQARRWAAEGHEITVFSSDPGRRHAPARQEIMDGVNVVRAGGRFTVYLFAALFVLLNFRRFDRVLDVANGIPFFAPLFGGKPVVLLVHHVHDRQWFEEFPGPLAMVGWFLERRVVPLVYRRWPVISVSPTTRDALVATGMRKEQIHIVYNGVDLPEKSEARRPNARRIAYVGRVKRYKRLDKLVRSVAQIRREIPEVHLDIAGSGDATPGIEALARELDIAEHVTVHGFVSEEEKAEILRRSAVFATPSMHEGWGLTVVEANGHGCPAVAYDVPGLKAAIRHGETGLLVENDDGFRDALAYFLNDEDARERYSGNARRWAESFSWDASARQTLGILRDAGPNPETEQAKRAA